MVATNGNVTLSLVFLYLLVGALWGCTNPFIKFAQMKSNTKSSSSTVFATLKKFFTDPFMFLPFLLNQSGSFFFYYILSSQPISIASPVCNSLSFMFTAITGLCYFKEEYQSLSMLISGMNITSYIIFN